VANSLRVSGIASNSSLVKNGASVGVEAGVVDGGVGVAAGVAGAAGEACPAVVGSLSLLSYLPITAFSPSTCGLSGFSLINARAASTSSFACHVSLSSSSSSISSSSSLEMKSSESWP
jgi:hypothetical protein